MRRFLCNGVLPAPTAKFDVLVMGSGLAGLYAALQMDPALSCAVVTKEGIDTSNSWLAQGGIAAAVNKEDKPRFHLEDTLTAGAGLCDQNAVRILVDEGPKDIETLVALDVPFDLNLDGDLETGREGGHRLNRIVHAHGDATGRETVKTLAAIAITRANITFLENTFLADILTDDSGITGAVIWGKQGFSIIAADNIVIAAGGIGQVYRHSTNPSVATGDGIAVAARAGADLTNMEFVQFHPTGLYSREEEARSFLISEAVRGEGAVLRNHQGERFMEGQHPMAELAPRDIVARAITREMAKEGSDHVYLDITVKSAGELAARFPTIYQECQKRGIDIAKDYIPVCPVQHYMMGGIATDVNGRTSLQGLYACGEAACTGVHGANRLASNSMLECLVFSRRAARQIATAKRKSNSITLSKNKSPEAPTPDTAALRRQIRDLMSHNGWVIRHGLEMEKALSQLTAIENQLEAAALPDKDAMETFNMATVSRYILTAAVARKESVGAHYRED